MNGLILQPTYRVRGGRPVVQLYGRLQEESPPDEDCKERGDELPVAGRQEGRGRPGPPFLVEDDRFRPYCFIRTRDASELAGEPGVTVGRTELRDFEGEPVARVVVSVPAELPKIRDRLERDGVRLLEADIRFPYRYLIDLGIRSAVRIEGEATRRGKLLHFLNPTLSPAEGRVRPALGGDRLLAGRRLGRRGSPRPRNRPDRSRVCSHPP